ncbi:MULTISPECIES: GntR family transcriptional regulator [unclassified Paenibacillus]|uniref:GntR family transcriptional regulator n=1 Tax=unclassified Paenibacillus TaxID=185978 RepID=UPI002404A448|nr:MULTISPECIES: GntR family transcriptional regulator [unclassified Paenibacillus]MDF9844507.1 DNA-binding GntR family transcriptional regulator [Paenibacillus sp. PastF-2]MDF9851111.1 DNA-binding GntR family transcriptional regulator [Paenibacillus sp. PastM-2]MDF9857683.1 DNA-binding GntR family transcriptional regulator [Paenibacillus sp. PastF-1]MDH6482949.1 DNA-binding GntR family transcriptional regulator [Paenibacillus sp. PastH-2]MDH6510374.1 DNA-binding GntR family transcriptional re
MGKQNQAQIAYDSILRDIEENQLNQGQPIIEEEYAKKLNMSRTPVREAIRLLSVEGFVTVYPRKGAYVSVLTAEDVRECYEMMEAVEGMIAYLAARQPSSEQIRQLTELVGRMNEQKSLSNFHQWKEHDIEFHRTMHRMCPNKLLNYHVEKLFHKTYQIQTQFVAGVNLDKATEEHQLILEAIIARDSEKARYYTQQNWNRARNDLVKYGYKDTL